MEFIPARGLELVSDGEPTEFNEVAERQPCTWRDGRTRFWRHRWQS